MENSEKLLQLREELLQELTQHIIPYWCDKRDDQYGGYYGYMSYWLLLDKKADKGCILNSRILWFFSSAYMLFKNDKLLRGEPDKYKNLCNKLFLEAEHAYKFLRDYCIDKERGGIYWSLTYDGKVADGTKHTYNQAFCIYALSAYYAASGNPEALRLAYDIYDIIESKCRDEGGYLEAFDVAFCPVSNEKLSENGVMAERTMNTLLHVMEAYTNLMSVADAVDGRIDAIKKSLSQCFDIFCEKIYNPELQRLEVFFDYSYNSLIDLHSFGHDIEASWIACWGAEVLGDAENTARVHQIALDMVKNVIKVFDGNSLANECENGVVNEIRIWWVQAENLLGLLNAMEISQESQVYLDMVMAQWNFIKEYQIDKRTGSEWYQEVTAAGVPDESKEILGPWKCPYHNGRMCIEGIGRIDRLLAD